MRNIKSFKLFEELKVVNPKYRCKICGSKLYRSDSGGPLVELECSSDAAKFWNFDRGSKEQKDAHEHFSKSRLYITREEWENLEKE